MQVVDITGETYGRLTVLRRIENSRHGKARWECSCICGSITTVVGGNLRSGRIKSCGCLNDERRREIVHGGARRDKTHPLFRTWANMIQRCTNSNNPDWHNYGGRGIAVCDRWRRSFALFLNDVGDRPADPADWESSAPFWSIDRIDPDGDYEPDNVRWATWKQQRTNRSAIV